jgi:hypothetical protein
MIRTDTAASSGEAEVAEADAPAASFVEGELTAVYTTERSSLAEPSKLNSGEIASPVEAQEEADSLFVCS